MGHQRNPAIRDTASRNARLFIISRISVDDSVAARVRLEIIQALVLEPASNW
jgi:hypothetical protein